MADDALKNRLKQWRPPAIDPTRKPRGLTARRFPKAITDIRGGGIRPGYRT